MKANIKNYDRILFKKKLKNSGISYLLMLPFMILFLICTVIPVVSSIMLSFTSFNMLETPALVGLENYKRLFLHDEIFIIVLKNTLIFAFITGPIGYLMSFICAWLINELSKGVRTLLTFIFYAPVLSGNVYFVWLFLFSGDRYGVINQILMRIGAINSAKQWLSDPKTILPVLIIVQLWCSLGTGFLAFIAGFQGMDKSCFEAGAIDGIKNRWQELFYITIPSMAPQLMFSAVMQIAASFGASGVIQSLAGFPTTQYSADTIVTYIMDIGTVRYEMGYASALAVFLFVLMIITNFVITKILSKYDDT